MVNNLLQITVAAFADIMNHEHCHVIKVKIVNFSLLSLVLFVV